MKINFIKNVSLMGSAPLKWFRNAINYITTLVKRIINCFHSQTSQTTEVPTKDNSFKQKSLDGIPSNQNPPPPIIHTTQKNCVDTYSSLGTQEITFLSESSNRNIVAELYYPTSIKLENKLIDHGVWLRQNYYNGPISIDTKKSYPLIIFSHGFQGDRFGNSWIAEKMVAEGYIVVMIEHTLNTSHEHSDLFCYTSMWQRPTDVSELLTHLLKHDVWGKVIDQNRIAAAGFSLGGSTALWLGGICADKDLFKKTLDMKYSRWVDWPHNEKQKALSVNWAKAELSYRDNRIKAVVAIAPDLGEAFSESGLKKMDTPALIIAGDKDRVTPKESNSSYYAKNIKNVETLTFEGAEHYTFMNKGSSLGFKITPHLCSDSMIRDEIHERIAQKMMDFLSRIFSFKLEENSKAPSLKII